MKLIVGLFFEYDKDEKKVETQAFIHSIDETIMWETNSNLFDKKCY